jgi:hypothetical protein
VSFNASFEDRSLSTLSEMARDLRLERQIADADGQHLQTPILAA